MPKERIYDIEMICRFCGSTRPEKWFDDVKKYYINMCQNCLISTTSRKGEKVRYAAAVRDLSAAIYADHHLTRGEVYTVSKTKPWIHGCYVYLENFGNNSFDLKMFTPENYEKFTEKARAYPEVPKNFLVLGHEERVEPTDLIWNAEQRAFVLLGAIYSEDSANDYHLVIRPKK